MDTNNAMPPHTPGPQAQPPVNPSNGNGPKKTDLYDAISRDDDEFTFSPSKEKKKQTPLMSSLVYFMKLTFYVDAFRRDHESFFHILGGLWAGFMGLIYLGGLVTLFLSFYTRARLPLYLQEFFEDHHLKYDSLKMADYSLTQIRVVNLHDEANKYVIPQLKIHSTFADFLQGRIRTITLDGLKLNLKVDEDNQDNLGNALKILGTIANPMEAGFDLKINAITMNNAVLTVETKNKQIPVNFSMSGLYSTKKAQVIIPFMVDEDFLKLDASLTVGGTTKDRELDLAIKSGTLVLPDRAPEELQGNITLHTAEDKVTKVDASVNLNYGHSLKTIKTDLTDTSAGFKGSFDFLYKNTADQGAKPLADLTLKLDKLSITQKGEISTTAPIRIAINHLERNNTVFEGIGGTLNGTLKCQSDPAQCQYDLAQDAVIRYQNLAFRYKEQNVNIDEPGNVSFLPSEKTLILQLKNSTIGLNWMLSKLNFTGFYNEKTNPLQLNADTCHLTGTFSTQAQQDTLDAEIQNGFYQTRNLTMKGISVTAKDLYNPASPLRFSADDVTTNSTLLLRPFSVNMTYANRQVKSNIRVKDTDIVLTAEGIFQPFQKTFAGQFKMNEINLRNLPFALHELSSIFPKSITKASGRVSAVGQLNFSGENNISGPFYLGLKNINFRVDDVPVSQVNGVVALQSLAPLVSAPNQNLYIGQIGALVPLININALFQLENQALRLINVNTILGNQELSLSSALIPYRKPNALLYLKTDKDFEIARFAPFLNLTGMTPVGGTGSLAIPVDVSEKGIELSSVTLKVNNMTLRKNPDQKDIAGLFQKGNESYMIRTGQLIFDKDKKLQLDLDGWLMPMRKREAFSKQDIPLNKSIFKEGEVTPVPAKILERQKSLSQMLSGKNK